MSGAELGCDEELASWITVRRAAPAPCFAGCPCAGCVTSFVDRWLDGCVRFPLHVGVPGGEGRWSFELAVGLAWTGARWPVFAVRCDGGPSWVSTAKPSRPAG
ncbi:hypothetical protein PLESTB_001444300 [Pleodorina starrii]|uniref:Uncharacterized protein n=1 Tax=Pleodorina starrii TaxID=330485 RepID=A0A9W6BVN6_9CHLO|nr:hypothetical protein PLESTB_001444300 [Pleodorina starrii]GLC70525.1 hypothetical protein PLESTF_000995900 [Pleodorina starrii]